MRMVVLWVSATILTALSAVYAGDKQVLQFMGTIPMEGIEGRIDHMAAGPDGRRLFVAARGSDMVEEIDTKRRQVVGAIRGIKEPQGIYYIAKSKRLAVASGGDGNVRIYDQDSKLVGTVDSLEDADNVRYDSASNLLYVGYGQGALAIIDPDKAVKLAEIPLDGHPESFNLEPNRDRIFVNVPTTGEIEVIDREQRRVLTKWTLKGAAANFPMALDERHQRLFIGLRRPARLFVLDTESGRVVTDMEACGDSDDLFYDSINQQIYLSGGAGCISVFRQNSADSYEQLFTLNTPVGSRTSLYISSTHILYAAVPHRGKQRAEIRIFNTEHQS
jgi:DNA-binding beta-propeller fold protein YncE